MFVPFLSFYNINNLRFRHTLLFLPSSMTSPKAREALEVLSSIQIKNWL